MDAEMEFLIAKAHMITQGLIEETNTGIKLLQKGKDTAYERWMKLTPVNRLLFGWLIKSKLTGEEPKG